MRAKAYAKVNLALGVFPRSADGYHPLRGVFQSVSLADEVGVRPASHDSVTVRRGEAPEDDTNLAWRAIEVARRTARVTQPMSLDLYKRIPSGSGLGGGSADAAAALALMADRFGLEREATVELAESMGADVPFSLDGGTKIVEGRGERLKDHPPLGEFALGIVVPPFSLSTPSVFREWDRLDGPTGDAMDDLFLPPSLRGGLPIRNDLFPAAVSLDARVGEWRDEIATRWSTAVAMTGSGSALFAFFSTIDEALSAVASIDMPTRATEAVEPVAFGWERIDE
jgi:4-diphosphocytidyl-2-C-methyl-D-erythritol kinase